VLIINNKIINDLLLHSTTFVPDLVLSLIIEMLGAQ